MKGKDAEPAGLPEITARFEAEKPDIEVNIVHPGRPGARRIVTSRHVGGNAPDVTMPNASRPAYRGGRRADRSGHRQRVLLAARPRARALMNGDGAIRALPFEIDGMGDFVNTARLAEAGIEAPPATIEETVAACEALAAAAIEPMAFAGLQARPLVIADGPYGNPTPPADHGAGDVAFTGDAAFGWAVDHVRILAEAECFDPVMAATRSPAWRRSTSSSRRCPPPGTPSPSPCSDRVIPAQAEDPEAARTFAGVLIRDEIHRSFLAAESA